MNKKKYEEYEYKNDKSEDIYNEEIYYNEDVYPEELDGLLKHTERNPKFCQKKDKENDDDSGEGEYTQYMKMNHPE